MTIDKTIRPAPFSVIDGGRTARAPLQGGLRAAFVPALPRLSPAELAGELGRLYALSLLCDTRFRELQEPECAIRIDGATGLTQHALLTELSALPKRPAADAAPVADLSSLSVPGRAGHRGASRRDDRWRTSDLLDGGVAAHPGEDPLSPFIEAGILGVLEPQPDIAPALPEPRAPMSRWLAWCEAGVGATLPMPGSDRCAAPVQTPRDLVRQTQAGDPRRAALSAALLLLSQGTAFDPGLAARADRGASPWKGTRLLSLMVEAARRAPKLLRKQAARSPALARPAVLAARLALMHECEEMRNGPDTALLGEVLAVLTARTPRLLEWVARVNALRGTGGFAVPNRDGSRSEGWTPIRFRQSLMLPALRDVHACDGADRAVIAGALMTLLKAVFALEDDRATARALDRMAGNIALGRSLTGRFYAFENAQNLRLGQGVALQLLREVLEEDGRPAALSFGDFDGRHLLLEARRCGAGRAHVVLSVDGLLQLWPPCGPRRTPRRSAAV